MDNITEYVVNGISFIKKKQSIYQKEYSTFEENKNNELWEEINIKLNQIK
jgi:hypothetical protein